jgi:hypothetical protein
MIPVNHIPKADDPVGIGIIPNRRMGIDLPNLDASLNRPNLPNP